MREGQLDVEFCWNNGKVAVRPVPRGRLDTLVTKTSEGKERCWVFGTFQRWKDDAGNDRFSHLERGVLAGDLEQWEFFKQFCNKRGLKYEFAHFFVPFSNGTSREGTFGQGKNAEPFWDYTQEELVLGRVDFPCEEDLIAAIAKAEANAAADGTKR